MSRLRNDAPKPPHLTRPRRIVPAPPPVAVRTDAERTAEQTAEQTSQRAAERIRLSQAVNDALTKGEFDAAFVQAKAAYERYESARDSDGQALVSFLIGLCYRRLNDLPASLQNYQESIARYEQLGDDKGVANGLRAKANVLRQMGRDDEAIIDLKRASGLFRWLGERTDEMRTRMNLSIIYKQAGDIAASQELLFQCLAFFEQADARTKETKSDLAKVVLNIATNYSVLEKPHETVRWAKQGIPLLEATDDLPNLSQALCVLGAAYRKQNEHETALEHFRRALQIAERLNLQGTMAIVLDDIASVYTHLGRFDEARDALERCLLLSDGSGNRLVYCGNLLSLGELLGRPEYRGRDVEKALACLLEARQIAEDLEAGMILADIHQALAQFYEQTGDYEQAFQSFRAFRAAERRIFNEASDKRIEKLEVEKAQKDAAVAQVELEKARKAARINHIRQAELAQALEEAERRRVQADEWARIDALTGVLNRRALDYALEEAFKEERKENHSLALALLDLDHFKQINDQFGHGVGDTALREVARLLQANCRSGDLIARYGGEEFALLLPGVDGSAAFAVCENLRALIAAQHWAAIHPGLTAVTVSIGVSVLNKNSAYRLTVPAALLAEADQNLYRAKRGGRNQVAG